MITFWWKCVVECSLLNQPQYVTGILFQQNHHPSPIASSGRKNKAKLTSVEFQLRVKYDNSSQLHNNNREGKEEEEDKEKWNRQRRAKRRRIVKKQMRIVREEEDRFMIMGRFM